MSNSINQKITPFLWFNDNAEEAMNFYVSIFRNSKIVSINRIGNEGQILTGTFQLEGQIFMAINGGPMFTFSPAISLFVNCNSQSEVDDLWEQLSAGGEQQRCGWLKDKYGISWQIIPVALGKLMNGSDPAKSQNVMNALLKMNKIDLAILEQAYDQ